MKKWVIMFYLFFFTILFEVTYASWNPFPMSFLKPWQKNSTMAVNYHICAIEHCWWANLMNLFLELSWAGLVPLAVWKLSFWPHWFFHSSRLPWVSVSTLAELSQWCEEPSGWPWAAVLNLCFTCNWSAFILHLWSIAHMQEVFWNGQIFQHFFQFFKKWAKCSVSELMLLDRLECLFFRVELGRGRATVVSRHGVCYSESVAIFRGEARW